MVLIDMEMPKCCEDCYVGFIKQVGCEDIVINNHESWYKRHPNCPLKEIQKPHGRLIDEDQATVEEDVYNQRYVIHAPTVVEAEYDLPQKSDSLKAT